MAFTVQNNQGVVDNANAYVDSAYVVTYHADRGLDLSGVNTGDLEAAIVRATDYLDQRFTFVGTPIYSDQTTSWPRSGAKDSNGWLVSGIPLAVKQATAEYANIALSKDLSPAPERDPSGQVVAARSEKTGPIEESIRYASAGVFTMPKYPKADRILTVRGLVASNRQVRRG